MSTEKTVSRAFRLPESLDAQIVRRAREGGYLSPSEYLRNMIREGLEKEAER